MSTVVIIALLLVNSVLVLAMLMVLISVLRQGKRIARLARESRDLANHVDRHVEGESSPDAGQS